MHEAGVSVHAHGKLSKNPLRVGDHAHKSTQRKTAWDGDDDGDPKFEQRVERDRVQGIRETYQDDWEKNVGRVGIGREKVPHAPLAVKVFPEEAPGGPYTSPHT